MRSLRTIFGIVVLVLTLVGTALGGVCRNCGLVFQGKGSYCPECARRLKAQRDRAMRELLYVERVAKARLEYEKAIAELVKYYQSEGDAQKLADARREQAALAAVPKYDYLYLAEVLSPDLKPSRSIPEADRLYREALDLYQRFAWPWQKRRRYRLAVQRLKTLLKKYPDSDKIDEAAYHLGRCYESRWLREYRRAVRWYQRCIDWNPQTRLDPRYRIARIYETRLGQRDKALQYYNLVVRDSANQRAAEKAQQRIDALKRRLLRERKEAVTEPKSPTGPQP